MLLRQREEEEDEGDEEDGVRLVMKTTEFLSLTLSNLSLPRSLLFSVSFVRPSAWAPPYGGRVQFTMGGAVVEGRVQSDADGIKELSVPFEDAQTALQQLEVTLQVRGAGPEEHIGESHR